MSRTYGLRLVLCLALLALLTASVASTINNDNHSRSRSEAVEHTVTAAPRNQEDLLKWGLANSDPDELRQAAREVRCGVDENSAEFVERQRRVQQLLDAMKGEPTEAKLMQEAIAILSNASSTHQQLIDALEALGYLVEPIDAANSLHAMGGMAPVVALLSCQQPPALQAKAAHVLGTAASNNHQFHEQLLGDHPEVVHLLLHLLPAGNGNGNGSDSISSSTCSAGVASQEAGVASAGEASGAGDVHQAGVKALYCLSTILRLNGAARVTFYQSEGMQTLQGLLGSTHVDVRLKLKALGLLTDLIQVDGAALAPAVVAGAGRAASQQQQQQQQQQQKPDAGLDYPAVVAAALQLLEIATQTAWQAHAEAAADVDMHEKALLMLWALLDSKGGGELTARLFNKAGGAATLARLQASLRDTAAAEDDGEYLLEVVELAGRVLARAARLAGASTHDAAVLEAAPLSLAGARDAIEL